MTLFARWVLSTNNSNASPGWYVDSIALLGGGDLGNQPPQITEGIAVAGEEVVLEGEEEMPFHIVADSSADLSVAAVDDGGADNLSFTWSAIGPESVFFMPNSTSGSSQTTAFFEAVGDYSISVSVRDEGGLAVTDSVQVRVIQTPAGLSIEVEVVVVDDNYEGTAIGTLNIEYDMEAYHAWASASGLQGADSEPHADPDKDGMSNLLEWRFGFDPNDDQSTLRISILAEEGQYFVVVNRVIDEGLFTLRSRDSIQQSWVTEHEFRATEVEDDYRIDLSAPNGLSAFYKIIFSLYD